MSSCIFNVFCFLFKDATSKESSHHELASASTVSVSKNINDSNIEDVEKASSNDGLINDGNNDSDEVVVEAKRRRKSPPVQIRQKEQEEGGGLFSPQRPPSSSLSEPSCEEPKRLSLKSPLDLEAVTRGRDEAMSPRNKSETEMASGSIQAALAALQAGQSSLNQVCKRILPNYE